MGIIASILLIILFAWFIHRSELFQHPAISKKLLFSVLILKIIAGSGLWMFYSSDNSDRTKSDIFIYYDNGIILKQCFYENPSVFFEFIKGIENKNTDAVKIKLNRWGTSHNNIAFDENKFISYFNGILSSLGFGNYFFNALFFIFMAFSGLWMIFLFFQTLNPMLAKSAFLIVFLLPSTLFWTSGIMKESLICFGIGWVLFSSQKIINNPKNAYWWGILILSTFILLNVRMLFSIIFLFPAFYYFNGQRFKLPKHIMVAFILMISIPILFHYVFPKEESLFQSLYQKQAEFISQANNENAGSIIHTIHLEPTPVSFLKNSPLALFNVLLQPIKPDSIIKFLAFVENILILFLIVLFIVFVDYKKLKLDQILFALLFSIFYLIGIGLIVPVAGALVRYKVPGIIFLLLSLLFSIKENTKIFTIISSKK